LRAWLVLLWGNGDDERESKFHDFVDNHFDVIGARFLELHLSEKRDIGCVTRGVSEREFDFAFSYDGCLVWGDQSDRLGEGADSSCPTIEYT
jgi:hypothetical protein